MKIKHISFDLWKTLIQPNPKYKEHQAEYISGYAKHRYNVHIEQSDLLRSLRKSSVTYDKYGTLTNVHYFNPLQILFNGMQDFKIELKLDDYLNIIRTSEEIFKAYPPTVINKDDILEIFQVCRMAGIRTFIVSNTGSVNGSDLLTVLNDLLDLERHVNKRDMHFSDETNWYKPCISAFFPLITDAKPEEVLHVGDNPEADGACTRLGINFLQINSNTNTIKDVLSYI